MNLDVENWELFDFVKIFDIKKGFYNKNQNRLGREQYPFWGQLIAIMVLPNITHMMK